MARARQIVKRLKAVKNIRKITRTMELIATARFKRAMDRATEAAAYTRKISEIVADLSQADLKFSHPLLDSRPEASRGVLLVLTSNRGLCGGYNAGVLRQANLQLAACVEAGEETELEVSGKRGINLFRFQKRPMSRTYTEFDDQVPFSAVDELASRYAADFIAGRIDRLRVAYMRFDSASRQTPVVETLLPIGSLGGDVGETGGTGVDYDFLPSAAEILEEIVPSAFKARLFKCFLDANVSEHIFRMVAMKGATENAEDMIGLLSQQYNRARQTQITSELAEIIGGVAALEG